MGAFDLKSELLVVPRGQQVTSSLSNSKDGMTWTNQYGYVAMNGLNQPFVFDGMNEKGLVVGTLYFPGFANYQVFETQKQSKSINNIDLSAYILGNTKTVDEVKSILQKIKVVRNEDLEKAIGTPTDLHHVFTDINGDSIVVEYTNGELQIYDNSVGVMTNSPGYDWHLLNIRNHIQLGAFAHVTSRTINGIEFKPLGQGSGMTGLPGDSTPPSRFIRALAFKASVVELKSVEQGVNEASRILNNFDIPRGSSREEVGNKVFMDYTQWSVIANPERLQYFWWTEHNRRMRMIDLNKIDFAKKEVVAIPLDKEKIEDIQEITL
ncbi:choloylglycine hydrolase family protein [Shewanella maritima]|uniref:Choloylglycine hydrolase family protein n=1 Tax=Shewanella maritima TaxID=2520507 RepID=A0A411PGK6_9GAMM|nr:choloylglycine hydrolase family protein [Shewanella maritima]QBF82628.1 choloylglycine hydrolase family protein [Shewanella maritima]